MDIESKERGVTHDTETGKSHIPNATGVSQETRQRVNSEGGVFVSKEVYEKFVAACGAQKEDAASRGIKYNPKAMERFTNVITANVNLPKLALALVVGAGAGWVITKAGRALARRMGWNLFGNVVVLEPLTQGEEIGRLRPARVRQVPVPVPQAQA